MRITTFLYILILSKISFGQNYSEFKIHRASIESKFYPCNEINRNDSTYNCNKAFINYTIEYLLNDSTDKQFISNRNILRQLNLTVDQPLNISIEDTLSNGKPIFIEISGSTTCTDTIYPCNKLEAMKLLIDGNQLTFPDTLFDELNNINFNSRDDYFQKGVEAYESLDGSFVYLYIYSGYNATTHFTKLIFNQKRFITSISADYYSLSIHSSFRKGFIGF